MQITLLDAPIGIGAETKGTEDGPRAIRRARIEGQIHPAVIRNDGNEQLSPAEQRLANCLRSLGHQVPNSEPLDFPPQPEEEGEPPLKHLDYIVECSEKLAQAVAKLGPEQVPVVLGGDHGVALGSISGVSQRHQAFGVVWVDAHADFNTCDTTPSGNIHGMILAALAGVSVADGRWKQAWAKLTDVYQPERKVDPHRVVIVGARSLDRDDSKARTDERRLLAEYGVKVFSMRDIDRHGITEVTRQAIAIATEDGALPLHLSFDIDAIDPSAVSGTGTQVAGGLTVREARMLMEMVAETTYLSSLDMVEVNPRLERALAGLNRGGWRSQKHGEVYDSLFGEEGDHDVCRTANLAAELICTAFGLSLYSI
jgi:arginase